MPSGSVSRHSESLLAVVHNDVDAGGGVAAGDVVTGGGAVGAAIGTVLSTGVSKSYERDVPKQTCFAGIDWETGPPLTVPFRLTTSCDTRACMYKLQIELTLSLP